MNKYDAETHEYYMDEIRVPHITELMGKPKFLQYMSEEHLEAIRQEGNDNHDLIKLFHDTGETFKEKMLVALQSWIVGHPEIGRLVSYETPLFSKRYRFGGTPDMVFEYALIDFKRTFVKDNYHALQLGSQHILVVENKLIKKTKNWFVMRFDGERIVTRSVYNPRAEAMFVGLTKNYWILDSFEKYIRS